GFRRISSPTTLPEPVTTFRTPLGRAAWFRSSMMRTVVSGVVDAGLTTIVHPAARAGPTLVPIRVMGKFQGTIAPHTPTGCFKTSPYILLSGSGTYDPRIFDAKPA